MPKDLKKNNKRIVKNVLFLYIRMFLIIAVSLYTSRVVLKVLGVIDFGIYNVIGGVVALMGLLNGAMTSATNRFFAFELGKNDEMALKRTFSMSINIYLLVAVIIVVLAETIGLWFVNTQLVIPPERVYAANYAFQFSVLSCIVALFTIPFNASIIAHEDMNVFAYVSIVEVLLKLGIVYLLNLFLFDKLCFYSMLLFLVSIFITLSYGIYCRSHYRECKYSFEWDKRLFRKLISYSGWNLFGAAAAVVKSQGLNVLLNVFFTPSVNASRGVSAQVNAGVNQFSNNFFMAVRPQIVKYYAQGDLVNMFTLVIRSAKLTTFLLFALAVPLIIDTPFVIYLWLGQMPEYVVVFTRLMLVISIVEGMSHPIMAACHATGRVALYQSVVGSIIIFNVPVSYVFLKFGCPPPIVYIISFVLTTLAFYVRLIILKRLIPTFPVMRFNYESVIRGIMVCALSLLIPVWFHQHHSGGVINLFLLIIIYETCLFISILIFGLDITERKSLFTFVKNKIHIN